MTKALNVVLLHQKEVKDETECLIKSKGYTSNKAEYYCFKHPLDG